MVALEVGCFAHLLDRLFIYCALTGVHKHTVFTVVIVQIIRCGHCVPYLRLQARGPAVGRLSGSAVVRSADAIGGQ